MLPEHIIVEQMEEQMLKVQMLPEQMLPKLKTAWKMLFSQLLFEKNVVTTKDVLSG